MRDALTRPRTIALLAVVAVVALVGALLWALATGGGDDGAGSRSSPGGTATAPGPGGGPAAPGSRGPGGPGSSGGPGAARGGDVSNGFLAELGAIDPALVADRDRAVAAGRATCQDLADRKPYADVVTAAAARFRGPGIAMDDPKATLIVDAARNHLCPG